ncbi:hypothetical protein MUY35_07095 [Aliiroseovarius sp. S1339]|uniref:hypothetical protein n=1 Tax=Aliiroseovarius sp. S1339 TaxID=2936990 RepID=UPI0020BE3D19|nr:hypothetical protein [Aliiroseovarius sp. S1339]MCK8463613.1 hypothetical protein [Aliiroseovarius sp. S1339]
MSRVSSFTAAASSASRRSKIGVNAASWTTSFDTFMSAASIRAASTVRDGRGCCWEGPVKGVMQDSMEPCVRLVQITQTVRAKRLATAYKTDSWIVRRIGVSR